MYTLQTIFPRENDDNLLGFGAPYVADSPSSV